MTGELFAEGDGPTGVLLMAYGTPETPDQVEAYFTHIRGGRVPSPESVAHLRHRYALVGGRTPLLDITEATRAALETELNADVPGQYRVYAGMKHWHPYIAAVLAQMAEDGIRQIIAIALAPHYSRISIGGYRKAVEEGAAALGDPFEAITLVESWHLQPEYLDLMAEHIRAAREKFSPEEQGAILTVFSAHSLPERIRTWDDPYESQLLASSAAVAERLGLNDWRFAWQSAGNTGEPWIGPDILDYLETLHAEGVTTVLQVPIGFVAEHLEVLFDIDYEAKQKAEELGMHLERTAMPNATPGFIRNLAAIVTENDPQRGVAGGGQSVTLPQPTPVSR
ncbi:MAG TPA: ferrochelatase [Thermomicrobiales bacterium]|jgi:ferrochelatase